MTNFNRVPLRVLVTASVTLLTVSFLFAAKKESRRRAKGVIRNLTYDPDAETVTLFSGLDEGRLDVRVVPKNEFEASVYISNKTEKPLTVVLPKAVAAVHVLKQYNGSQAGNGAGSLFGNQQQQQQAGGAQGVGGAFQGSTGSLNQSNSVNNGNNNGIGFFSIPPEKTVLTKIHTVCLEHGKKTPSPSMKYVLRKVEDYTSNPVLQALLENYDSRKVDRKAMQAAAWHLANHRSWKQLQSKKLRLLTGVSRGYFSRTQLKQAQKLVAHSKEIVAQPEKKVSPRKTSFVSRR